MGSGSFCLVTTWMDAARYAAADLANLQFQRGEVELSFRDIKTTTGRVVLRCRSAEMAEKEILMHFIAYNAIRWTVEAADAAGPETRRLRFKGSIPAWRQWESQLGQTDDLRE